MRSKPAKPVTAESVRKRLASLCARSEQCEEGIRQKLMKTGLSASERQDILDFLKREKFVDNARYARALVRDAKNLKLWSRRKTMLQLAANRIPRDMAREAIEEEYSYEDEIAVGAKLMWRAYRARKGDVDYRWQQTMMSSMARRGFPFEIVIQVVRFVIEKGAAGEDEP